MSTWKSWKFLIPRDVCIELGRVGHLYSSVPIVNVQCGLEWGEGGHKIVAGSLSETERLREQPGWFAAGGSSLHQKVQTAISPNQLGLPCW